MRRGPLPELASHYCGPPPKGEIVVLVGPPPVGEPADGALVDSLLKQALAFMPVKAAAGLVAEATGSARRTVYLRALALKREEESGDDREA